MPYPTRLLPFALIAALAACGQQHEPEASTDAAPAVTDDTTPSTANGRPPATTPTQQVGMGAANSDSSDSIPDAANPTGRGVLGDAGRGQGAAPTPDAAPAVTEAEALQRCRDSNADEGTRSTCEARVREGFNRVPQPTQSDTDIPPDLRATDEGRNPAQTD